ncbi:MAG: PH domain-containing protein [Thaumarchaeota archaeon]|nr:PH domain-containing protein [Nitrososphaerota archaeon]
MAVPKVIQERVLQETEKIIVHCRQNRIKKLIHPRSLVVTDKQILIHSPRWFGYRLNSFDYSFIQDVFVTSGLFFSKVRIKTMWADVEVSGLRKHTSDEVVGAIRKWLHSKPT